MSPQRRATVTLGCLLGLVAARAALAGAASAGGATAWAGTGAGSAAAREGDPDAPIARQMVLLRCAAVPSLGGVLALARVAGGLQTTTAACQHTRLTAPTTAMHHAAPSGCSTTTSSEQLTRRQRGRTTLARQSWPLHRRWPPPAASRRARAIRASAAACVCPSALQAALYRSRCLWRRPPWRRGTRSSSLTHQ
jgi:hypothetical protein